MVSEMGNCGESGRAAGVLLGSGGPTAKRREGSCVRLLMLSACPKNAPACGLMLNYLDMVYNLIPLLY